MCLILFAYQAHPDFPLIVAANRDEYYDRPAQPAHFWDDFPQIFAGRDLQAGGTWMGLSKGGRFAAVTNYRQGTPATGYVRSRGELCLQFLSSDVSVEDYLAAIELQHQEFAGFNLLVGDFSDTGSPSFGYCSNRHPDRSLSIAPGIHGVSNSLLNTNWPKVTMGKQIFAQQLTAPPQQLMSVLLDSRTAPRQQLPDTGIDIALEEKLSSRFIATDNYGTRATTVLRLHKSGKVEWLEQTFGPHGTPQNQQMQHFQLDINPR